MSLEKATTMSESPVYRLVALNVITVVIMVAVLFIVYRTFNKVDMLFDTHIKGNLQRAVNSFELDKDLIRATVAIHENEDVYMHDPEAMIVGRQEVENLVDEMFRKIKLSENYFSSGAIYQSLLKYRQLIRDRMEANVLISKKLLQLSLANEDIGRGLETMEEAVGRLIIDTVLAGREVSGLYQINALLPFCREQLLRAASATERAVSDLHPAYLSGAAQGTTAKASILGLSQTLETVMSAHETVAHEADHILKTVPSYLNTLAELRQGIERKNANQQTFERMQQQLNEQLTLANKEMEEALLQVGEAADTELDSSADVLNGLFVLVLLLAGVGGGYAIFLGRRINTTVADLKKARAAVEKQIEKSSQEVKRRTDAEIRVQDLNRNLEATVASRTAELYAANMELEDLVYSMSHDLRTPLRGIAGFSRVLLTDHKEQLDDAGQSYLERIEEGSISMGKTIDAIIELSRLSREPLQRTDVDLSAMAGVVVEDLRRTFPDQEVQVDIAEDLKALASKDLARLILENLFENAWKFTRQQAKGRVVFGCEMHGTTSVYYLRDNGVGFDMQYNKKLFRPFQRLHAREDFPGIGIGLALVLRATRKHGGTIWAASKPNEGATFYFTFTPTETPTENAKQAADL